jgi:hypothetical protein
LIGEFSILLIFYSHPDYFIDIFFLRIKLISTIIPLLYKIDTAGWLNINQCESFAFASFAWPLAHTQLQTILGQVLVFALDAPAGRAASFAVEMAFAVVLLAFALLAVASQCVSRTLYRKELLLVAARNTLAGTRACNSLLETLTVVLLASCLAAGAFSDRGLGFR